MKSQIEKNRRTEIPKEEALKVLKSYGTFKKNQRTKKGEGKGRKNVKVASSKQEDSRGMEPMILFSSHVQRRIIAWRGKTAPRDCRSAYEDET